MKKALSPLLAAAFICAAYGVWAPDAAAQPAPTAQPSAQPSDQSDEWRKNTARELATKGFEYFESGQLGKALQYFKDAEERFHAPTLVLLIAKTHMKLDQYVEARDAYQRIIDEQLPDTAPKEFLDAKEEAKKTVDLAAARIATLKITLKGMTPDKIRLTIDDVEIPTAKILTPLPQNPGNHKIVATLGGDEGGRAVYQAVDLKAGTTKQVQLVFRAGQLGGPPPSSGGCASCEVGAHLGAGDAVKSSAFALVLGALAAVRRRKRR